LPRSSVLGRLLLACIKFETSIAAVREYVAAPDSRAILQLERGRCAVAGQKSPFAAKGVRLQCVRTEMPSLFLREGRKLPRRIAFGMFFILPNPAGLPPVLSS
jgi:hypothetical protein